MPGLQVYNPYFRTFHQPLIFLSFTLSFILHALLIGMVLFFQKRAFINERERFITVSIYSAEEQKKGSEEGFRVNREISAPSSTASRDVLPRGMSSPESTKLMTKEISRDAVIEESIHAIKAKKRIEQLARLRAEITEIGTKKKEAADQKSKMRDQAQEYPESGPGQRSLSGYGDIVKAAIQGNWHYPELAKKGLTATVIIHVGKDGAVKTIDFKTSGERFFDYSVKNAILRSSPLPPPPEECEIELRFSR